MGPEQGLGFESESGEPAGVEGTGILGGENEGHRAVE